MVDINSSFKCGYTLADATAANTVSFTTENSDAIHSDVTLLAVNNSFFSKIQTSEHNFSVLDGSFTAMNEQTTMGFVSSEQTGEDGTFTNVPTLTAIFNENHSSIGFTLGFIERYPLECEVSWYNLAGNLINKQLFDINSCIASYDSSTGAYKATLVYSVENYSKVIFRFTKAVPKTYIKINSILFGIDLMLDETVISSGKLVSEIDRTGSTVPISTLSFDFIDLTDNYNLGNNTGIHLYVQPGQKLYPIENIDDEDISLGLFYIKSFSVTENKVTISAQDIIGMLDSYQYLGSGVYLNGISIADLLSNLLVPYGFSEISGSNYNVDSTYKYKIDDSVDKTSLLYGTLKPQTGRNALKEILLATQTIAYSDENGVLIITKQDKTISTRIGKDIKISTKVTKNDFVSGITVNYSKFEINSETSPAVNSTPYTVGEHTVTFNTPYKPSSYFLVSVESNSNEKTAISSSVAEIVEKHTYYVIIKVYKEASIEIDGIQYKETKYALTANQTLVASAKENIKSYNSTLCNRDLAITVAESILNYYNYRLGISIQYLASGLDTTKWCIVKNPNTDYEDFIAMFNSIAIDLTNGFVVDATLVGVYNYMNNYLYAGDELIANNNTLI